MMIVTRIHKVDILVVGVCSQWSCFNDACNSGTLDFDAFLFVEVDGVLFEVCECLLGITAIFLQTINCQSAPCQNPVSIQTTKILKNQRGFATRFPPSGIYT